MEDRRLAHAGESAVAQAGGAGAAPAGKARSWAADPATRSGPGPAGWRRREALLAGLATLGIGVPAGAQAPAPGASPAPAPAHAKPAAPAPRLRLLGAATLPSGLRFRDTVVGGLSALDYDPQSDIWYLLSDDRSDHGPARYYTARLRLDRQGLAAPELLNVYPLLQPGGQPYPSRRQGGTVPDPEALRWRAATRSLIWTSEGDARLGLSPFIRELRADGSHWREFSLPPMFAMQAQGQGGPRDNLAFEGLALTPDGRSAWVAMENALWQDGPVPTLEQPGGPCRFTRFDLDSGSAVQQRAYTPDAIPLAPLLPGAWADNGVSEILMLDAQRMLVLERAYALGRGNSLRLYLVDLRQGSDTLALAQLQPGNHLPLRKTLVVDFAQFRLPDAQGRSLSRLDNTEGMAWGPVLPAANGQPAVRTLVFVSDDNFNPAQITQFVAFEFTDTPETSP